MIVGIGDAEIQTRQCIENIERALRQAGASLDDVVRTRIYVADIDNWQEVGTVHARYFGDIRPASTMVEVSRFISSDIMVEIEADAYLTQE